MPSPLPRSSWRLCVGVLHHKQEIMFRDGSAVDLHEVHVGGLNSLTLRATKFGGDKWLVFDLARIAKSLGELPTGMNSREVAGEIFKALRMSHASLFSFRKKVEANLEAVDLDKLSSEVDL